VTRIKADIPTPYSLPEQMLESLHVDAMNYDGSEGYLVTVTYREDGSQCADKFIVTSLTELRERLADYSDLP